MHKVYEHFNHRLYTHMHICYLRNNHMIIIIFLLDVFSYILAFYLIVSLVLSSRRKLSSFAQTFLQFVKEIYWKNFYVFSYQWIRGKWIELVVDDDIISAHVYREGIFVRLCCRNYFMSWRWCYWHLTRVSIFLSIYFQ